MLEYDREEEQLEAEAGLKRAALAAAWGSRPTPAKGPSLLDRQVEKKPPILKMEVNVGGYAIA